MQEQDLATCARCRSALHHIGLLPFRVGGTSGAAKLFFGEWAELGETKFTLDVLACPACRQVAPICPEITVLGANPTRKTVF